MSMTKSPILIWLKEAMGFSDGIAWRLAEVNGRKMGLPYIEQAAQNDKALVYATRLAGCRGHERAHLPLKSCTPWLPLSRKPIWDKVATARPWASSPAGN